MRNTATRATVCDRADRKSEFCNWLMFVRVNMSDCRKTESEKVQIILFLVHRKRSLQNSSKPSASALNKKILKIVSNQKESK